MASSNELVCSDCVPPSTAANASSVVRTTLFHGSCAVSEYPLVWLCVRSSSDFSSWGLWGREQGGGGGAWGGQGVGGGGRVCGWGGRGQAGAQQRPWRGAALT